MVATRRAEAADAEGMGQVLEALLAAGRRQKPGDAGFARAHYLDHPDQIATVVAVDPSGRILGFQSLKRATAGNELGVTPGWGIIGTHVHPGTTRRGEGRVLFGPTRRAAEAAGLRPVKLNAVVVRHFNDEDMIDLARLTLENEWEVRFIEMMPFGEIADFQQSNVVSFREMRQRVESVFGPLEEASYDYVDPSRPFRIPGAKGTLGFISSVTEPFCQGCGRIRLTADGKLRLCLLRDDEVDLLTPLRAGASYEELRALMRDGAFHKPWGHGLAQGIIAENRVMNQIGG